MRRFASETLLGGSRNVSSSLHRSISSSRSLREEEKNEEPVQPYSPRVPVIKPRHSRKYASKHVERAIQTHSRKWLVDFVDKEKRREFRFETEKRKKIDEEKKLRKEEKQRKAQENAALAAKINAAYALQKSKIKEERRIRREREERQKAETRKEFLQLLSQDVQLWDRHPRELAFARFRFDQYFRFAGSNFANQYVTRSIYPYVKTKSSRA